MLGFPMCECVWEGKHRKYGEEVSLEGCTYNVHMCRSPFSVFGDT